MKANVRMLPRLNLCYLQKKAYQNHCRKLSTVKSTLHQSLHEGTHSLLNKSSCQRRVQTIQNHRAIKPERGVQYNPLQKRMQQETQKQNQRLFKVIKNCSSSINRKQLLQHSIRSQSDTARMQRFRTDPSSQRKVLKCKLSLQKIDSNQKKRQSRVVSRLVPSYQAMKIKSTLQHQQLKVQVLSFQAKKKEYQFYSESAIHKQVRTQKQSDRHLQKIRRHFQDKQFNLIAQERLKGFREKAQSTDRKMHTPQIHKWKTRCFTTQLQSYQ